MEKQDNFEDIAKFLHNNGINNIDQVVIDSRGMVFLVSDTAKRDDILSRYVSDDEWVTIYGRGYQCDNQSIEHQSPAQQ